jgi:hypothetical protein
MTISPETIDHAALRVDSESEEKAHTDWMREKVAESLADPRPNISNEQAMNVRACYRKELLSFVPGNAESAGSGSRPSHPAPITPN